MALQRDRSEWRGEAYPRGTLSLSDATKLAVISSIMTPS